MIINDKDIEDFNKFWLYLSYVIKIFCVKCICLVSHINGTNIRTNNDNQITKKPFTLEEIYLQHYYIFGFNGTWISDTEIMVTDISKNDITVYDVVTKKNKRIFDGSKLPVSIFYNLPCNLISERLQSVVDISFFRFFKPIVHDNLYAFNKIRC